jgi:hypothetical protein
LSMKRSMLGATKSLGDFLSIFSLDSESPGELS